MMALHLALKYHTQKVTMLANKTRHIMTNIFLYYLRIDLNDTITNLF